MSHHINLHVAEHYGGNGTQEWHDTCETTTCDKRVFIIRINLGTHMYVHRHMYKYTAHPLIVYNFTAHNICTYAH